jgi:hypothetical protein
MENSCIVSVKSAADTLGFGAVHHTHQLVEDGGPVFIRPSGL